MKNCHEPVIQVRQNGQKKYFVTVSNGNITQIVQRDSTKIVYASNHMKKIDVKL